MLDVLLGERGREAAFKFQHRASPGRLPTTMELTLEVKTSRLSHSHDEIVRSIIQIPRGRHVRLCIHYMYVTNNRSVHPTLHTKATDGVSITAHCFVLVYGCTKFGVKPRPKTFGLRSKKKNKTHLTKQQRHKQRHTHTHTHTHTHKTTTKTKQKQQILHYYDCTANAGEFK